MTGPGGGGCCAQMSNNASFVTQNQERAVITFADDELQAAYALAGLGGLLPQAEEAAPAGARPNQEHRPSSVVRGKYPRDTFR